mgnify:CR=1 FL=1
MTSMETNEPVLGDEDLNSSDSASMAKSDKAIPKRGRDALGIDKTKVTIHLENNSTMASKPQYLVYT